ncbi:MAG TPA: hypothetical protein VKB49_17395 [Candidatus Sulfotelmatobacter sp.]|nr:hypothetical protein [Candidatus Sulfotelmatobacter sp.]
MPCKACDSANLREFPAESNVHFPGMEGLDIPTTPVFTDVELQARQAGMKRWRI